MCEEVLPLCNRRHKFQAWDIGGQQLFGSAACMLEECAGEVMKR